MQQINLIDESCGFCAELHDISVENNLLEHYIRPELGLSSRVILQTEHFEVIPTLGAFVEGYVMVVSKEHHDCSGKIPADLFPELKHVISQMKDRIFRCYGMDAVCFEHGSVSCTNRFGGCINHAHIHIVPCKESLINQLADYQMEYRRIGSIDELRAYGGSGHPYLYFADIDGQQYVVTSEFVVSQFFRQLLAKSHGVAEEWDWRTNLNLEKLKKTYERLRENASQ